MSFRWFDKTGVFVITYHTFMRVVQKINIKIKTKAPNTEIVLTWSYPHEVVMSKIKERLKDAYDKVIFYADKTWANENNPYQKANQELYVREMKLRDLLMEETTRPRTVQDCIPKSKLAKYSNYEYNESRELSYASNVANVSFYYPCTFKRDSIKEPWMLPEIEQLFIWLTYSSDFNLLDPIALEELNHLDDEENIECGLTQNCTTGDFHQVNPFFYKTLERAPGKPRYTPAPVLESNEENLPSASSLLQINTFEDMLLRIKLKSEKVQNCWTRGNTPLKRRVVHGNTTVSSEKKFNIFKSPLGNFFIFENARNIRNIPNLERIEVITDENVSENVHEVSDFAHLQDLTNSFSSLQAWVLSASAKNIPVTETNKPDKNETIKIDVQPTKRLYSAVLQGLSSNNIPSLKSEQTTSSSVYTNITQETSKQEISPRTICSTLSNEVASTSTKSTSQPANSNSYNSSMSAWQSQPSWEATNVNLLKNTFSVDQSTSTSLTPQNNVLTIKPQIPSSVESWSKPVSPNVSYTNSFPSNYTNTIHSSNVTFNNNFNNPYGSNCFSNNFATNNYNAFNVCSNNFTNCSYANNTISYTFSNNIYANSQISSNRNTPQLSRQTYTPPPIHLNPPPSILLIQQHRAAALYPFPHYPSAPHYLCLPTPPSSRPSQRWQSSYLRSPSTSSQSYHVPLTSTPQTAPQQTQHWGIQNQHLYRSNSNQVLTNPSQQVYDVYENTAALGKMKNKTKKLATSQQTNLMQYKTKSKSNLECSTTRDADFRDLLFDSSLKKSSPKNSKCPSDMSIPTTEKTILIKSSTSNSSLENRSLNCQVPFPKVSATGKRASETILFENTCNADRLALTSSLSEDLERQALEQYQESNENFYQELERQAAEQCNDFSENWIRPPNNMILFGGLFLQNIRFVTNNLYVLLMMYVDIHVCNYYCSFLLS